jgi:hypothetical protein
MRLSLQHLKPARIVSIAVALLSERQCRQKNGCQHPYYCTALSLSIVIAKVQGTHSGSMPLSSVGVCSWPRVPAVTCGQHRASQFICVLCGCRHWRLAYWVRFNTLLHVMPGISSPRRGTVHVHGGNLVADG